MSNNLFEKKIKLIDKNITTLHSNKLNIKESLKLLKSTTNLLSSAKELIISQYNTISDDSNNFLIDNNLDKYYNDLVIRKKTISDLTQKYKSQNLSKNSVSSEENLDDPDNESNALLNRDNPNELGYMYDNTEALMKKANTDLDNIYNNMTEIKKNISGQSKDVSDLDELVVKSEKKAKSGNIILDDIIKEQNYGKCLLIIFNILLFVLILSIIIFKLL
jgi:hypothetical protein